MFGDERLMTKKLDFSEILFFTLNKSSMASALGVSLFFPILVPIGLFSLKV